MGRGMRLMAVAGPVVMCFPPMGGPGVLLARLHHHQSVTLAAGVACGVLIFSATVGGRRCPGNITVTLRATAMADSSAAVGWENDVSKGTLRLPSL